MAEVRPHFTLTSRGKKKKDIFLNQTLTEELTDCLCSFVQIRKMMQKRFNYLLKGIIKNYNVMIDGKNFNDQSIPLSLI